MARYLVSSPAISSGEEEGRVGGTAVVKGRKRSTRYREDTMMMMKTKVVFDLLDLAFFGTLERERPNNNKRAIRPYFTIVVP